MERVEPIEPAAPSSLVLLQRGTKDHTPEEWEHIRPIFTKLYIVERKPLSQVSRILAGEHNFSATQVFISLDVDKTLLGLHYYPRDKQYKDRARKWDLRKNFKTGEKKNELASRTSSPTGEPSGAGAGQGRIPEKRLRRFARDAKLQYVERARRHLSQLSKAVPEPRYDIVIEMPFPALERKSSSPRAVHAALAMLDRLSRTRYPMLDFSVVGVSGSLVRYGLVLRPREMTGLVMQRVPSSAGVRSSGRKEKEEEPAGMQLRFSSSWAALQQYRMSDEEEPIGSTVSMMCRALYQACLARSSTGRATNLPSAGRGSSQPPGDQVRCLAFSPGPASARSLYLQLVAHSSVVGVTRAAFDGVSNADVVREFIGDTRLPGGRETPPPRRSWVENKFAGLAADVSMSLDLRAKTLVGSVTIPLALVQGRARRPRAAGSLRDADVSAAGAVSRDIEPSSDIQSNLYLLDTDEAMEFVDSEFRDAAERAAIGLR